MRGKKAVAVGILLAGAIALGAIPATGEVSSEVPGEVSSEVPGEVSSEVPGEVSGQVPQAEAEAKAGEHPKDPNRTKAMGKVTSVEGNAFTIQTPRQGELKVVYDDDTKWRGGSASDLKVGVHVAVIGTGTDPIQADGIGFMEPGRRPHRKHFRHRLIKGEIKSVGDHEFRLQTRRGEITVRWSDDTKFVNGSSADLEEGAMVGVAGRVQRPESTGVSEEVRGADRRARIAVEVREGKVVLLARVIAFPRA